MANGVELATAYISLTVETAAVKSQIKSAFNDASATGRVAGERLGTGMADGMRRSMANVSFVKKALEDASRGAGVTSGKRFFDEFRTTSQRVGAVTGLVIGKTVGLGITAGLKTVQITGAIFTKLEVAARQTAVRMGAMMATAIRSALSATGVGMGIAGIAGVGGVLTMGLDRLKTIQRSQVQLSLKLNPQEVKQVQSDITDVVQGIPVNLDQAMQAVPKALNSGMVKQGADLKQYIMDIANTAASTGGQADFQRIDLIFGQVIAKGKLMGEEMMQLQEAGVDMRNALKEAFGWDDKTLNKNIEKGKVGINEMRTAVQKVWGKDGGLAVKMNETFDGAVGTMKASVARIGAGLIGAIFGDPNNPDSDPMKNAAEGINKITDKLKGVEKWVKDNREGIHGFFSTAAKVIGTVFTAVGKVIEFLGKFKQTAADVAASVGRAWDNVTTAIGKVKTSVEKTIDTVKTKFTDVVGAVKKAFDSVFGEDGWFAKQFKKLGDLVDKVRDVLGLGPATANAAPDAAPFNSGPVAPGKTPPLPPGTKVVPGTIGPGSGGTIGGASMPVPAATQGGRVPYGLPPGTNTGGYGTGNAKIFPSWVMEVADYFGIKASTYPYHQTENRNEAGYAPNPNNLNRGIDWVGPVENLQRFAQYLESIQGSMEQVIWQNPNSGRKTGIAGGKDVSGSGYYDDGTYASHGGNDPNNIHVHTRQSMSIPLPVKQGANQSSNEWQTMLLPPGYAGGGGVRGAGTGSSDSIPAMLSNGEHVLTSKDVAAMGGQDKVYAFRSALQAGLIPGFETGGAVDEQAIKEAQLRVQELGQRSAVAQQQLAELGADATNQQKMQAEISARQSLRDYQQASADLPIIASGGTPPDRSKQNNVDDTTDAANVARMQLDALKAGEDVPQSQMMQAEFGLSSALRNRDDAIAAAQPASDKPPSFIDNLKRTQGFTPTSGSGKAGTSSLANFIGMGGEMIGGLIDTGASLAQTAASMGAAAMGAPGGGAAASYGIQLGAAQIKRVVNYGFELAGIGADALVSQLFPLGGGAPRWMGYDYTGLIPQTGLMQAATTTLEQMGQQEIAKRFGQQGGVNIPGLNPGALQGGTISATGQPGVSGQAGVPVPGDSLLDARTKQMLDPTTLPPGSTPPPGGWAEQYPWFKGQLFGGGMAAGGAVGIYDQGGILGPGDIAVNKSKIPEKVLTKQQWDSMAKLAKGGDSAPTVKIDAIYGLSPEDVANQIESKQRLASMRYTGRPYK